MGSKFTMAGASVDAMIWTISASSSFPKVVNMCSQVVVRNT